MNKIYDKIRKCIIPDSEIIQDIEHAKRNDPYFDINNVIYGSWSSLIIQKREELIEYLLADPNINVNYEDWNGYTALHCAYNIPNLKLLLGHKNIEVNIQNKYGWTVLHRECYNNHIEIIKILLLDSRINIIIRNNERKTAQDYAILKGHLGIANMLKRTGRTSLLRIPNKMLCWDITRMIIEEYV